VSKAALDRMIEAWRTEHPNVGFTRVTVGDCTGGEGDSMTQFANDWNPDLAVERAPIWLARGLMSGSLMEVEELITAVHTVLSLGASASVPNIAVTPRAVPAQ
jgi:hypothetical protein